MSVVVDANVFKGFFQISVIGLKSELSADPTPLFLGEYRIALDDGGKIEAEWEGVVEREWFRAWIIDAYDQGLVSNYSPIVCALTKRELVKLGFPRDSKDIWYVRTAMAIAPHVNLVSEDMDFYDPKKKALSGSARKKVLLSKGSPVRRFLDKERDISVSCVEEFLT